VNDSYRFQLVIEKTQIMNYFIVTIHLFFVMTIITITSYYSFPATCALSSNSSNQSLRQQIIHGATIKLITNDKEDTLLSNLVQQQSHLVQQQQQQSHHLPPLPSNDMVTEQQQYRYYVRHGRKTEINKIIDTIMNIFHPPNSQSNTFDSYIRRYKYNQLHMLFDIIDNEKCGNDRVRIFVVCALPVVTVVDESSSLVATSSSSSSSITSGTTTANTATMMQHAHQEQIVGFCSVDGRANDPSSKLEYLTPSLLAGGLSPRPYLSDLGVVVAHRRRGIARELVSACEQWTRECGGHDKLYLKVEKKNGNAVKFYKSLGYVQTKLPWEGAYSSGGSRWDTTLLLEKSLMTVQQTQQLEGCISKAAPKRRTSWIKSSYIWRPNKTNE